MKKIIIILSITLLGCKNYIDCSEIQYRDGFSYYKGSLFTGECQQYYPHDQISSQQFYLNGKDNGQWSFYFPNGNLKTVANFNLGTRIGTWRFYHENGNLWKVNNYSEKGEKTGIWKTFSEDGKILDSINLK